jgi:hypothetical protein
LTGRNSSARRSLEILGMAQAPRNVLDEILAWLALSLLAAAFLSMMIDW